MSSCNQSVVLLGAGNVGTQLGIALKENHISIKQVWSRSIESAKNLGTLLGCPWSTDISEVDSKADIYIYALSDTVIGSISAELKFNSGLHLHTAGSVSYNIFSDHLAHTGVLYPFQTFSKEKAINFKEIPIFIESKQASDLQCIYDLASRLSNHVSEINEQQRSVIHLAGVFACNFSNHLYTISKQLLEEHQLPFHILLPLIQETITKLSSLSPEISQTGPAVRHDSVVMEKHINMLEPHKEWQQLYEIMSKDIEKLHPSPCAKGKP